MNDVYVWQDSVLDTVNYEQLPSLQNRLGVLFRIPADQGAQEQMETLDEFLIGLGVNLVQMDEGKMNSLRHARVAVLRKERDDK